ncbi:hypothetical protein, partial [Peribacillus simplex]|uniref:hypothetical protein n=1 Tax=Peribacillus simplex TaxID=1478 RepID=UPI001624205E
MNSSFVKPDTTPKMYLTTGEFHDSNQQVYYSNKYLEFQKKQDELNKQLANNIVKHNNEINGMIRNHQILKDSVGSHHSKQNNINQDLLKQISQHDSIHDHLSTQLNEQKEMSQGLSEQIHKNEIELSNQLVNIHVKLNNEINGINREHQRLKDSVGTRHSKQNDINQDLLKQISQHDSIHDHLSTQLNEQKEMSQGLSEQIHKN